VRSPRAVPVALAAALAAGCAAHRGAPATGTLAELRSVEPDVKEAKIDQGLDQAMQGYRRFLDETPETAMTPEAMRRLADLKLEKQFGIHAGDGKPRPMAAPASAPAPAPAGAQAATPGPAAPVLRTGRVRSRMQAVRSRRSRSTTSCSPTIRTTRTATRSSTRSRGRSTSSAAPKRPSTRWSA